MPNLIKNKYLNINNKIIKFLPVIFWMIFIFYLSSGQTDSIKGNNIERFLILKSFHLIEYAVLFICFKIAGFSSFKSLLFSYIYALSDEFHQSFVPGRSALFRDTLIDFLGSLIPYIFMSLTCKKYNIKLK
jgi:VanZ family protein